VYELIEHTADVGVRSRAQTLEGAFSEAARGMAALMADVAGAPLTVERPLRAEGHDLESLLHAFLAELLYVSEVDSAVFPKVDLRIAGTGLIGTAMGAPLAGLAIGTGVKAVTFHALSVRQEGDTWVCEVLFDI